MRLPAVTDGDFAHFSFEGAFRNRDRLLFPTSGVAVHASTNHLALTGSVGEAGGDVAGNKGHCLRLAKVHHEAFCQERLRLVLAKPRPGHLLRRHQHT